MTLPPLKKASISPKPKKKSDGYLINIDDYKIIRNINRGGFGIINLVKNTKNGKEYAAKTNLIQNKSQNDLFITREVRILSQIQHCTVIQFHGFSYIDFDGYSNITILMDYMSQGSLANLIENEVKSLCPVNYDNTKRQIILVGIARGMMLLHKQHVIHRDLKPENILLDSEFHPRITDFGLSKFFDPYHSMSQSMSESGTAAYMAPEVIKSNHFNTKADVYAFGILMYEVVSGKRAYFDSVGKKKLPNLYQLKKKVEQENFRPKFDFPIKKGLKLMIEKCWSKDPKERPTFCELFKKLSLSKEDYFIKFDSNYEEPKIIDESDDDDDENEFLDLNMKYCLENVDVNELLDYVDEIKEEVQLKNSDNEVEELRKQVQVLNQTIKEQSKIIQTMQNIMNEQSSTISSLKKEFSSKNECKAPETRIKSLEEQILSHQKRFGNFFSIKLSKEEPGILAILKEKQKTPFDRLFVASASSRDIYCLLLPFDSNKKEFGTSNSGKEFIQFELEEDITLSGLKIKSAGCCFPKSFDIEVEGEIVKSIKEANELNGQNKVMTISFTPIRGRKVRFIQTGPAWDAPNFLSIRRFEILSTDEKYSNGVFATLLAESENQDPHKCPVFISSLNFDFNNFHILNTWKNILNVCEENYWFQVELTKGIAILSGFRLKKYQKFKLKSFKVICTDDSNKPESLWTTLIEINEKTENEHEILDIYEFPHPSPPTRFVRLIQTGKNWQNNFWFDIFHFDLFGCYF